MCCASRFCTGGRGAAGSRSSKCSPGKQSEAPRRRGKPGQEQHPGPENQDSQHMLNQPKGSFSESIILGPQRTPPEICLCLGSFLYFEAPNMKHLWGQGFLGKGWGDLGRGFQVKLFLVIV